MSSQPDELDGFLTGQLLLAMPHMEDPRFAHAVIFICAHSERGALGIMINRPLQTPSFPDLLRQLNVQPIPPARTIRLLEGGPVEHGRGFVLHTTDWTTDDSLRVDGRVALTASLEILKAIARGEGPREGVLALGYAGWDAGQLDAEIHQNAWLNVPVLDLDLLFSADHAGLWRRAMASLRIDPSLLSGTAGHA